MNEKQAESLQYTCCVQWTSILGFFLFYVREKILNIKFAFSEAIFLINPLGKEKQSKISCFI